MSDDRYDWFVFLARRALLLVVVIIVTFFINRGHILTGTQSQMVSTEPTENAQGLTHESEKAQVEQETFNVIPADEEDDPDLTGSGTDAPEEEDSDVPPAVDTSPERDEAGDLFGLDDVSQVTAAGLGAELSVSGHSVSRAYIEFDYLNEAGPSIHYQTELASSSEPDKDYVVIGEIAWSKSSDDSWERYGDGGGVWAQALNFLPEIPPDLSTGTETQEGMLMFSWKDETTGLVSELHVDPVKHSPVLLHRYPATGSWLLEVEFLAWNESVEFDLPDDFDL